MLPFIPLCLTAAKGKQLQLFLVKAPSGKKTIRQGDYLTRGLYVLITEELLALLHLRAWTVNTIAYRQKKMFHAMDLNSAGISSNQLRFNWFTKCTALYLSICFCSLTRTNNKPSSVEITSIFNKATPSL